MMIRGCCVRALIWMNLDIAQFLIILQMRAKNAHMIQTVLQVEIVISLQPVRVLIIMLSQSIVVLQTATQSGLRSVLCSKLTGMPLYTRATLQQDGFNAVAKTWLTINGCVPTILLRSMWSCFTRKMETIRQTSLVSVYTCQSCLISKM